MQHPLFVPQDDFRRLDLYQTLQTVVPDDYTSVQIVQVRSCKTSAIERNQWTQFGRNHWHHLHNHPFRFVCDSGVGIAERFYDLQTLQGFTLSLLRRLCIRRVTQCVGQFVQLQIRQHVVKRLGSHLGDEFIRILIVQVLVFLWKGIQDVQVLFFCQKFINGKLCIFSTFGNARLNDDIALVINDLIELFRGHAQEVTNFIG